VTFQDGLQMWRLAANILNKQSRTANKGDPSAWELGKGLITPHTKKINFSRNVTQCLWIWRRD